MSPDATRIDLPTCVARARGLAIHLFPRAELEHIIAEARDLDGLAATLTRSGRLTEPVGVAPTPAAVERTARRTAAQHLRVLARWAGNTPALDVFYADQDRRIARAMIRGALQGAPIEQRMAGLLPTPRLPERVLVELSHQSSPARVAAHLVVLRHPGADRLLEVAKRTRPVLLELEVALLRAHAERARVGARAGDENLRQVVAWRIDVGNAQTALLLATGTPDVDPAACFVDGGNMGGDAFALACRAESPLLAAQRFERALRDAPVDAALRGAGADAWRLDRASLVGLLAWQLRRARIEPLSSAPLVAFLLRLEAQSEDLRRIAWGAALGAPASLLRTELVTPWS